MALDYLDTNLRSPFMINVWNYVLYQSRCFHMYVKNFSAGMVEDPLSAEILIFIKWTDKLFSHSHTARMGVESRQWEALILQLRSLDHWVTETQIMYLCVRTCETAFFFSFLFCPLFMIYLLVFLNKKYFIITILSISMKVFCFIPV